MEETKPVVVPPVKYTARMVAEWRKQNPGRTYAEISAELGVPKSTISNSNKWMHEHERVPSPYRAKRVDLSRQVQAVVHAADLCVQVRVLLPSRTGVKTSPNELAAFSDLQLHELQRAAERASKKARNLYHAVVRMRHAVGADVKEQSNEID